MLFYHRDSFYNWHDDWNCIYQQQQQINEKKRKRTKNEEKTFTFTLINRPRSTKHRQPKKEREVSFCLWHICNFRFPSILYRSHFVWQSSDSDRISCAVCLCIIVHRSSDTSGQSKENVSANFILNLLYDVIASISTRNERRIKNAWSVRRDKFKIFAWHWQWKLSHILFAVPFSLHSVHREWPRPYKWKFFRF